MSLIYNPITYTLGFFLYVYVLAMATFTVIELIDWLLS